MTFSLLLSCFILIIPIFGKAINYTESLILYGGTILFLLLSLSYPAPKRLTKRFIVTEIILIFLSLVSSIFSQNIGYSYYALFNFIFSLIILNLCLTYLNSKKLSKILLIFSLFYSFIFLLNRFHFIALTPDKSFDNFILQIWGHSYLADFLIFSTPFLLYQLLYSKFSSSNQKYFYYFSLIFILITTLFTNSRSAIIAISISTIYIILPKIAKYLKISFILLIICLATFLNYQSYIQNRNIKSYDGKRLEYWNQAIKAFIDRPLLGHGPGNFFYINKKYQNTLSTNTNYAHNSFLEYLCLNGLPFTLIIFAVIILSLLYQRHHHPLNFVIGLTALTNSLLDPSWNSIGIFCISLFYIFSENPQTISSLPINPKEKSHFSLTIFIFAFLFFLSKTSSDYFFISKQPQLSLYLDPFNLNPRLTLLPQYLPSTLFLYSHNHQVYKELVRTIPLPQSESFYYQLFSLIPKENISDYGNLAKYYLTSDNLEKLDNLLTLATKNFNPLNFTPQESIPLAQTAYKLSLIDWQKQHYDVAIKHLRLALRFGQSWAVFHVELANAYWHTNQKELALKQLNTECQRAPESVPYCQEYLNTHSQNFLEPGTAEIQDSIKNIAF